MKLERIQDAIDIRNARCPICNVRFEVTHAERKPKKKSNKDSSYSPQEFIIKKRTITLKTEQPKIQFSLSTVNDSVRMKCDKTEDAWQDRNIHISCRNQRHSYSMTISFKINRFRMETKDPTILMERFFFNDGGKRYELRLDYVGNESEIFDPGHGSISKVKPAILEITNKKDIIQKIDRLFNFA